jgi:hypothetical protein
MPDAYWLSNIPVQPLRQMKRRARKLVVAVAIAVIGAGWLFLNQGDRRFVGRWESSAPVGCDGLCTLQLNSSGTGWIRDYIEDYSSYFEWRVQDSLLILSPPRDTPRSWLTQAAIVLHSQFSRSISNRPRAYVLARPAAWKLQRASPGEFQISPIQGCDTWLLGTDTWRFCKVD